MYLKNDAAVPQFDVREEIDSISQRCWTIQCEKVMEGKSRWIKRLNR